MTSCASSVVMAGVRVDIGSNDSLSRSLYIFRRTSSCVASRCRLRRMRRIGRRYRISPFFAYGCQTAVERRKKEGKRAPFFGINLLVGLCCERASERARQPNSHPGRFLPPSFRCRRRRCCRWVSLYRRALGLLWPILNQTAATAAASVRECRFFSLYTKFAQIFDMHTQVSIPLR